MKLAQIAVAVAAIATSAISFAGSINSTSNVTILAFDGQKVKKSTKLETVEGKQHQAVVEVSGIYRTGSDEALYESAPIVVAFNGSAENITIKAPKLSDENAVSKFKRSPALTIETASGNAVAFKQDILKGEGFLPNANISENLAVYNAGDNTASVKGLATTAIPAAIASNGKASKGKVMVQGENIAEQQLQYWFQQADKETQKRFLDWAKKQ